MSKIICNLPHLKIQINNALCFGLIADPEDNGLNMRFECVKLGQVPDPLEPLFSLAMTACVQASQNQNQSEGYLDLFTDDGKIVHLLNICVIVDLDAKTVRTIGLSGNLFRCGVMMECLADYLHIPVPEYAKKIMKNAPTESFTHNKLLFALDMLIEGLAILHIDRPEDIKALTDQKLFKDYSLSEADKRFYKDFTVNSLGFLRPVKNERWDMVYHSSTLIGWAKDIVEHYVTGLSALSELADKGEQCTDKK